MNNITLLLTNKQIDKLLKVFEDQQVHNDNPYIRFVLKLENCTITCYNNNKVLFQGKDAKIYASPFKNIIEDQTKDDNLVEQAGSDEVGTGDYFGPVVVAACIVNQKDYLWLRQENIDDSKKINDEQILKIGSKLIQKLPNTILILDNEKYNIIHQHNNLNEIKAKLHNQAYINLSKKYNLPKLKIIDQFTPENTYYRYLANEPIVISNIHFETKAESKYISVAAASMIARYVFLVKWQEMEQKYNFSFHKGASTLVDEDIKSFIALYGYNQLHKVAKLHFKNTPIF